MSDANTKPTTLRIAGIPQATQALPLIHSYDSVLSADGEWETVGGGMNGGSHGRNFAIPEDVFAYEARDLSLESVQGVWRFSEALGNSVLRPWDNGKRFSDVVRAGGSWAEYTDDLRPFAESLGVSSPTIDELKTKGVHVSEVALRQSRLRELGLVIESDGQPEVRVAKAAVRANLALSVFAPHFGFVGPRSARPLTWADASQSGYAVAVLQAFNRVVGGVAVKTCARAQCGRRFFNQRGRARHSSAESHRREDAIYCSASCAKRAAQQAWRARQRVAKAGE